MLADEYVPPSRFTPINRPGGQLVIPQLSTSSRSTDKTHMANKERVKRHNPVIAQYLGLGTNRVPINLEKFAPALPQTPTTPPKGRKRARKSPNGSSPSKPHDPANPNKARQRRVSDSFRVTKPVSGTSRKRGKPDHATSGVVSTASPIGTKRGTGPPGETRDAVVKLSRQPCAEKGSVKLPDANYTALLTQSRTDPSSDAKSVTICANELSQNTTIGDEFGDDIFESIIDSQNDIDQLTTQEKHQGSQDSFGDIDLPDSLWNSSEDFMPSALFPPSRASQKTSLIDLDRGSARPAVPGKPSSVFKSPVTKMTKVLLRKEVLGIGDRKPIVRPLFPGPVRDRSPIIGLSPNLLLRTCFRIGEAINQAAKATKSGQNIIFELYGRVLSSERDAAKQHFVFTDLFHERPPHLKAEYDANIWKQVELFNYDSGRFLFKAKTCRCVGQIKRNDNKEWIMVVFNIWEAAWEDIEWVEGIVNA